MRYLVLFGAEALVFLMATLNIRACAKGRIVSTLTTDAVIAGLNFVLIRKVADAQSTPELLAFTAGAVVGSAIGMYLTRHWTEGR